ncbi:MAG: nucleotide exchange factor GrpE [Candidatus Thermoplasmatota archaeon]|nr:nucleotide exchange factor GrpE [Candidatus Thermoplasmatota archaeon]
MGATKKGETKTGKAKTARKGPSKKKIAELEKALGEEEEKILRLLADFDNCRKRMEKETAYAASREKERLLLKFIDIYENLQSAYDTIKDDGLGIVLKQFKRVLEGEGVKEIDSVGKKFDYKFHHAIATEESIEYEDGIIMKEVRKGYAMNDKVIKPAYVVVSKGDKDGKSSGN